MEVPPCSPRPVIQLLVTTRCVTNIYVKNYSTGECRERVRYTLHGAELDDTHPFCWWLVKVWRWSPPGPLCLGPHMAEEAADGRLVVEPGNDPLVCLQKHQLLSMFTNTWLVSEILVYTIVISEMKH